MKKYIPKISAVILLGFGLITLFLSTTIIFDLFDIRAKEGNYVLFVVVANLLSSLLYLVSAYGLMKSKSWTTKVLGLSALVLISAFIALLFYIYSGGIYETKVIGAMIFRISITLIFTAIAYFYIPKKQIK